MSQSPDDTQNQIDQISGPPLRTRVIGTREFRKVSKLPTLKSYYNINITNSDFPYVVDSQEYEHPMARFVELVKKFQPGLLIDEIGIKEPSVSYQDYLMHRLNFEKKIYKDDTSSKKMTLEMLPQFVEESKKNGTLTEQNTHLIVIMQSTPIPLTLKNVLPRFEPYFASIDPKNREKFKEKAAEMAGWMKEIKNAVESDQGIDFSKSVAFDQKLTLEEAWDIVTLMCESAPGCITHAKFNDEVEYIRLICEGGLQLNFFLKDEDSKNSGGVFRFSYQGGIGFDWDDLLTNWNHQNSRHAQMSSIAGIAKSWSQRAMEWIKGNYEGPLFTSDYPGDLKRKDDALEARHQFLLGYSDALKQMEVDHGSPNRLWQLPREIIDMIVEYVVPRKDVRQWTKETEKLKTQREMEKLNCSEIEIVGEEVNVLPDTSHENSESTSEPVQDRPKV